MQPEAERHARATLITAPHPVRSTSAAIRPATTALRAMGSERNRSTRPRAKSVFRPGGTVGRAEIGEDSGSGEDLVHPRAVCQL
ncbi:MAG TPA: hypothetical protein VME19_03760 [Streptosporangiaceae bacterium]|nr:hypothetical protein [Streptosporangiaceae bacterium]